MKYQYPKYTWLIIIMIISSVNCGREEYEYYSNFRMADDMEKYRYGMNGLLDILRNDDNVTPRMYAAYDFCLSGNMPH